MGQKTLVLGGIRSGKTALAEQTAAATGSKVVYVATATAGDEEMAQRIERHRALRPDDWGLAEEPVSLGQALMQHRDTDKPPCLLVDSMSLWLSNLLAAGDETLQRERVAFLEGVQNYPGEVVIVSNEVGLGIIGMDALTRRFCDELGRLNQDLASECHHVVMSVAGLPVVLKEGRQAD